MATKEQVQKERFDEEIKNLLNEDPNTLPQKLDVLELDLPDISKWREK